MPSCLAAIVRNKQFPHAGRLRVNMGNIYFEQKKYTTAIKMYRMALDQIPGTAKEVRYLRSGYCCVAFTPQCLTIHLRCLVDSMAGSQTSCVRMKYNASTPSCPLSRPAGPL